MSLVNSLAQRDAAVLMHPQTDWRAHEERGALVVTRGEGVHVFDENGKGHIEGMAGLWCTALGFSEPRLVEAARRQMSVLPYEHVYSHQTHRQSSWPSGYWRWRRRQCGRCSSPAPARKRTTRSCA